jgi:Carboxypeptidase regulatory-like domain
MNARKLKEIGAFVLLLLISLICVSGLRAQETGDIVGTVTDTTGAVIPNATVTLTNTATNISQTAQTAADGNYLFTLLQVGSYVVKVQATGFKTATAPPLALSSGDRARSDIKLEVGEQTTTVEVQAGAAPALQTDTSNVGLITTAENVENLPLNGRNLIQLVALTPGITTGSPGSIVQGNRPDDRRLISSFSVNGQTDTMNNNLIDGLDNNERIIGTIGVRPSIDAVQELNVQTNKYDASVGRTGGGVVDVVTKSGTNAYHGSGYEFFRNKVLNANPNWNFNEALAQEAIKSGLINTPDPQTTAAPNPAFQQNQFGGSIGGAIKKDKTFFFADYEGLDYNTGTVAGFYSVPTLCEKGLAVCPDGKTQFGDFSDLNPISTVGGSATQPSPAVQGPSNIGKLPLCGIQTVANAGTCLSNQGVAYFNAYPLPNTGAPNAITNNYTSAPVKTFRSDTYDGRIDEHFNDKNTLYGRFTHNGETTQNPTGFPNACFTGGATGPVTSSTLVTDIAPGGTCSGTQFALPVIAFAGPNTEVQNALAFSYVHVFNPNLLLNLKASAFRSAIISLPPNNNSDISNTLGFQCIATACVNAEHFTPGIVGSGLATDAVSGLNGAGALTNIGDASFIPLLEFDTTFQYLGTLTWNHNAHSVRAGLSLIRRRATIGQSSASQGTFTFNGSYTGVAPGDLLEGLDSALTRNNSLDQPGFRTWEPSIFVQDDWRARQWLTVNLGMRYDIFTPYTEVHGRISNYDPFTGLVESPALPGLQQSNNTAGVPTPLRDFAPRIGFAATLKHNLVVRGGFGLTYFPVNYESPYYFKNAPFGYSASCGIQNVAVTNNSCATAAFNAGAGQFSNGLVTPFGTTTSTTANTTGQLGGGLFQAGLPTPELNIALATNTANYRNNGVIASVPVNLQEEYLEQFNLEVEKQFGANVLNIAYVGQRGVHVAPLNSSTNQNLPANPSENSATQLPMAVGGASYAFGQLPGFAYFNSTSTGASEEANIGTSFYNALQASLVRRFSHGLTINVNYVWSHITDNVDGSRACVLSIFATPEPCWYDTANGAGTPLNTTAIVGGGPSQANACALEGPSMCVNKFGWQQGDWGNGTQDVADRVSWGVNYQIPFGNSLTGVAGAALKGWGVNTSGSWQTGLPFSVTPTANTTGISGAGYVDQTCSGRLANPTILKWFNLNCFVQPTAGTLGRQDPNQFFGPSQQSVGISLFKEFPIKEQLKLQFRTEIFNAFNNVSFNTPSGTALTFNSPGVVKNLGPGSANTPGEITAVNANFAPREIQFALKLLF